MKKISAKEHEVIEEELRAINPLFADMWNKFERMVLDECTETAELEIHKSNFRIVANPEYWAECSQYKKLFVICHEMCHVMFGHWLIPEGVDREWSNVAQDIEVNEYLLKNFFDEARLEDADLITIKSLFKHKENLVERDRGYKYYYGLIMQCV